MRDLIDGHLLFCLFEYLWSWRWLQCDEADSERASEVQMT